jgi:phosphoglycerol transferase MdoB-like AlkP superfamily enzyme
MKIKVKDVIIETEDILTVGGVTENEFGGGKFYTFLITFKNHYEFKVVIQGADYSDYDNENPPSDKDMRDRLQKIYEFVCKYWVGENIKIPSVE